MRNDAFSLIGAVFLGALIACLDEEVEVNGSHVPPGVEGPLHGGPRYELALIFVNDLQRLQQSTVSGAVEQRPSVETCIFLIYIYFPLRMMEPF